MRKSGDTKDLNCYFARILEHLSKYAEQTEDQSLSIMILMQLEQISADHADLVRNNVPKLTLITYMTSRIQATQLILNKLPQALIIQIEAFLITLTLHIKRLEAEITAEQSPAPHS